MSLPSNIKSTLLFKDKCYLLNSTRLSWIFFDKALPGSNRNLDSFVGDDLLIALTLFNGRTPSMLKTTRF